MHHAARDGLRDEEGAAQIGVEHQVPVVPGDVERGLAHVAAGVVDQDVNLAERRSGCFRHVADAGLVADIERERERAAAEGFDLGLEGRQVGRIAAGDDQVGARAGEGAREILAEAAARAGDDGDLAGEIERAELASLMRHALRIATGSRLEHDFHQIRFLAVKAVEPRGPSSSGANAVMSGATEIARAMQSIACGYSPRGRARALQANLARHHFLQRQLDFGRDVADQRHRAAFAHAVDGGCDGRVAPTASNATSTPRPPVRRDIASASDSSSAH